MDTVELHADVKKRVGRPRLEWARHTLDDLWRAVTRYAFVYRWETFRPQHDPYLELLFLTLGDE
eukprot:12339788-Prorocentrum_lima.AAC.1